MLEKNNAELIRDLDILENIENNPNATQASLASHMNVAIGTVNLHLKRLIENGYIEIQRSEKRKLKYIITPEGITLHKKLSIDYIQNSFEPYRLIRKRIISALNQCIKDNYMSLYLDGSGDVAEICMLSCMEKGLNIMESKDERYPVIRIAGLKIFYEKPENVDHKEE